MMMSAPLPSTKRQPSQLDRYQRLEKLGEGSYGIVYRAKDVETDTIVALKKIRTTAVGVTMDTQDRAESGVPSTALREISVLLALDHPNVVKLHTCLTTRDRLLLVFEYVDCDLKKYLDRSPFPLQASRVQSYMQQLLRALDYCHEEAVLHRDIKPQNILVTEDETTIKLADFGLAREIAAPYRTPTHEVVTLWYRPIEILLGMKRYTYAVDLWSTGCVFAEMTSKKALFPGDSEVETIFKVFRFFGTPNGDRWAELPNLPDFWPDFPAFRTPSMEEIAAKLEAPMPPRGLELFLWLMQYDPHRRPTAEEALQHPYFHIVPIDAQPAAP